MIVYLEITSFIGMSIGAIHFYGELKNEWSLEGKRKSVDLERKLSARQATELRKNGYEYVKAGSRFRGFDTKQEIIDLALKTYKEHFPEATILILGSSSTAQPQEVLDGPEDFKTKVNDLYQQCEQAGWWEGDEKKMRAICKEWDLIMEGLKEHETNN